MQQRSLKNSLVISLLLVPAVAAAQRPTTPATGYPIGEAIEVYRAALDLLYIDGNERPTVIVMMDTVQPRAIGPCPQCPWPWKHKSKIDTATIQAYAGPPYGIPPIRPFAYEVPIRLVSRDDLLAMMRAGEAYDAAHLAIPEGPSETPLVGEFRRRFPGAWGWVQFTVVGLNPAQTEALLGIHQHCGDFCAAREMVFFRKINGKWTPIERVPTEATAGQSLGNLRYRGPIVKDTTESELVSARRLPSRDDPGVYRTVLDSLYTFHGERPGVVVISARRVAAPIGLTDSLQIDSTTQSEYRFVAGSAAEIPRNLRLRVPVKFLSPESRSVLEREGQVLERRVMYNPDGQEPTGFWRAFRSSYPQAWGYAELSIVGYNPDRTRALVYSAHRCGERCLSSDAWLLTRNGDSWSISKRIRREELAGWYLDSLRHLGRSATLAWYKAGRVRGVFRNRVTGNVFPNQEMIVHLNERPYRTVRTDARGRYSIEVPRFGHVFLRTSCPGPHRDTLHALDFPLRPALDTTRNLELDPRRCLRLVRTHPWIAGGKPGKAAEGRAASPQEAAVYRSVLDFVLPGENRIRILLQAQPEYICEHCVEREVPRLLRKGIIKESTEANFLKTARDSGPPPVFPYRRQLAVFPADDEQFLRDASDFWDVMKDAYPGVRAIASLSTIGFDDQRSEALVQVGVEQPGRKTAPEVMLLRRSGAEWRVALRHVTRAATSGEWSGGKCEPTDAPSAGLRLAETRTLIGTYMIVRVHASRQARGSTDTTWVRLSPLEPSTRPRTGYSSDVRVVDMLGRELPKVQSTLEASDRGARIIYHERLPAGVVQFDGWFAEDAILRVDPGGFYGRWRSQSGMTVPDEGHFCARKIAAPQRYSAQQSPI